MSEEQVLEILEAIATQLGTPVEMVWSALLRQAMIAGVMDAILSIILLSLAALGIVVMRKFWNEEEFTFTIGLLMTCIGGLMLPLFVRGAVTALLNPQYWAIRKLLSMLVGGE